MDLANFWEQIFYPLDNLIIIFFIVLITVLSERIATELEKADRLDIYRNPNTPLKNILNFIFRFVFSFVFVMLIVLFIIILVSLFMALIGIILNYLS